MVKKNSHLYLKHIFYMAINNTSRFYLSIIGLSIGIIIFTLGNLFVDSYYKQTMMYINQINPSSITAIMTPSNQSIISRLRSYKDESLVYSRFLKGRVPICIRQYTDGSILSLNAIVQGISAVNVSSIPAVNDSLNYINMKTTLIKGRLISSNDLAQKRKYVIIDEFTEEVLFNGRDSIGETISLNSKVAGISSIGKEDPTVDTADSSIINENFEIIGVIADSYKSKEERMKYYKFLDGRSDKAILETMIYCPVSIIENEKDIADQYILIWTLDSHEDVISTSENIGEFIAANGSAFSDFSLKTLDSVMKEHAESYRPIRLFLYLLLFILLLISGINTMSTMFFTIKERINEIGIKKAMGAKKIDILLQFVFEGMFLSLFAACIGIIISIIISFVIGKYLNNHLYILFSIQYSIKNILLPICIAEIYGLLFSLIPSLYGANIKVTEALRFE